MRFQRKEVRNLVVASMAMMVVGAIAVDRAAAQANDACVDAIFMQEGTANGSTVGADSDGSASCGASELSPDVWYEFTAPLDGQVIVNTCVDPAYDTVLSLHTGCPGTTGNQVACNDDGCGLRSSVATFVAEGASILIRVSGFSGGSGTFTLTVQFNESGPPGEGGPDVIYSDVINIQNFGQVGGIRGYIFDSFTCNIGDENLLWGDSVNGTPVLAMNAFRLDDDRLTQIGMSWVKHACCALAGSGCGMACNGQGGVVLGVGCRDVYGTGWNGIQDRLGPRSGVNPTTGVMASAPGGGGTSVINRRLQIPESELADNSALYFIDGVYVGTDDAQTQNDLNNASYRRVTIGGGFNISTVDTINIGESAIYAWHDHGNGVNVPDDTVEIVEIDVPGDGRIIVGSKVKRIPEGWWHYEYAIYNLNSGRGVGGFTVPRAPGSVVKQQGFSDIDYHSGEVYDNTDWTIDVDATSVKWESPQPFIVNADGNAIRWATMYNFWFDSDTAPRMNTASFIELFVPGVPTAVRVVVPAPVDVGNPGITPNKR